MLINTLIWKSKYATGRKLLLGGLTNFGDAHARGAGIALTSDMAGISRANKTFRTLGICNRTANEV